MIQERTDLVPPAPPISAADLAKLRDFVLAHPRLCVLTGAGMSTESGIPDYRSPNGSYSKGHKPITWQQFSRTEYSRQRYWARSMAGWEFMDKRSPNASHAAVAELERLGRVELLITQNVDRLHQRAGSVNVCELHGTIFEVECTYSATQPTHCIMHMPGVHASILGNHTILHINAAR